jgi:hypothetical protein
MAARILYEIAVEFSRWRNSSLSEFDSRRLSLIGGMVRPPRIELGLRVPESLQSATEFRKAGCITRVK